MDDIANGKNGGKESGEMMCTVKGIIQYRVAAGLVALDSKRPPSSLHLKGIPCQTRLRTYGVKYGEL